MSTPHVVVAGAGIAGLTASLALARAGVTVTLLEKRGGFDEVGVGLQLSPNASHVLIRLGLAGALARHAVAPQKLEIRRWTDPRGFAGMPMRGDTDAPFWAMRRADLQTALLDAVRMQPNIRLLVGRTMIGCADNGGEVTIELETTRGQRDRLTAAVLVGADGLWSAVRPLISRARDPAFLGYEAWRALIPVEAVESFARFPAVGLWLGRNCHLVHYPVAAGRELNIVLVRAGQEASRGWDHPADPAELSKLMASACPTLRQLMGAAPAWRRWPLFDRADVVMGKGRVALVGDAAHPVLPFLAQGAAMAIEDAVVLTRELVAGFGAGDPSSAIAGFGRARSRRVAKVQQTARRNAKIYHAVGLRATARDFVLKRLGEERMRARFEWLYGWRAPGA